MFKNLIVNRALNNTLVSLRTRTCLTFKPQILIKPKLSRSFNIRVQTPNRGDNNFSLIFKSFLFTAGVSHYCKLISTKKSLEFNFWKFTGTSYSLATILQYEREKYGRNNSKGNRSKTFQARNEVFSQTFTLLKL